MLPPLSSNNRQHVVNSGTSLIASSLHQAFVGLLSDYKIARQAQAEIDKLIYSKWLSKRDVQGLVALQAIVAESIRLSLLFSPPEILYQITDDLWYNRWFLPKHSIIIFDRDEIIPYSSKLSDTQVFLSFQC
jgi:dynactin complex subunit